MSDAGVSRITPHVRLLEAPAELRKLQAWILWRYEQEPNEPKPRKVPYWASGQKRFGQNGGALDRAKLVTFDAAREAAARRGFDGVGFCPLPDFGITALDFDHCLDDRGRPPPEVLKAIDNTYCELSPSGTGLRAFIRGSLGNHKALKVPGATWGFETFATAGYVTFTGNAFWTTEVLGLENTIADAGPAVSELCVRCFGSDRPTAEGVDPLDLHEPRLGLTVEQIEAYLSDLDPSMGRDPWIRVGMALHHECDGDDTGFLLWNEWSSGGAQYPGEEALQAQWDSFTRRAGTMRPVTMASVKKLSNEARREKGLEPRTFDPMDRFKEDAPQAPVGDPVATPEGFTGKFPIVSGYHFAQRDPPDWIIKGVLPKADLGVMYGASGSGKSFVALDLAMAIARGAEWRGRRVKQMRVMYLAAEGGGGVAMRLRAYADHHMLPLDRAPLGVMESVPNLMDIEDVAEIVDAVRSAGGVDLIIVDTFAQVTAGANENSGEDMGKAIRHARRLREMTRAMVLLIHHSGKDVARGARGWSGIRAAADVELEVVRSEETDVRLLRTTKQKDGRDDLAFGFTLEEVQIGLDRDGDPITSLVVQEAEAPSLEEMRPSGRGPTYGPMGRAVLDYLATFDLGAEPRALSDFIRGAAEFLPDDGFGTPADRRQRMASFLGDKRATQDLPILIEHGMVRPPGME